MQARELARSAARRIAPGWMANRARRYEHDVRRRAGLTEAAYRLLDGHDPVVQAGPFAGMRYPPGRLADVDAAVAKLLGTYEREIAWVFERAITDRVSTFIDIGCADGYYAVGMAHASPAMTTLAYDLSSSARELCSATAAASGVADRVRVGRRFSISTLPADGSLILCDIEGAEVELLDAGAAAALAASVAIVEVHEDSRPGAGARLRGAFAATHNALVVTQEPRTERDLGEHRGPHLHWIVFEPKSHG